MKRLSRKIWICSDVWRDILPSFDYAQLGLKMALISPRFDALVDTHFNGKTTKLTLWRRIIIRKDSEMPKIFVDGKSEGFALPDRPLPIKIGFNDIQICYIDHSVLTFIRSNKPIWDRNGSKLELSIWSNKTEEDQPIWDFFAREIWPIFATNICNLPMPNIWTICVASFHRQFAPISII